MFARCFWMLDPESLIHKLIATIQRNGQSFPSRNQDRKERVKEEKILETRRFSLKTIWSFLSNLSLETPVYQTPLPIKSFFKNLCLILYMHMGLCGYMFERVQVPVEARRGKTLDTLEMVLTGCCELPDMGPGNQTRVFGKSSTHS